MVSFAKLLRIRQGIGKKYKNIGLEKFLLSIIIVHQSTTNFTYSEFSIKKPQKKLQSKKYI
jgi:hypothetical protein